MRSYHDRPFKRARVGLVLLAIASVATACLDHAEPILEVPEAGPLFQRYVSLGNSITAGFQSEGIHLVMQNDAYPVVLAEKAGAGFGVPELALPGCPPPLSEPLGPRISDIPCAGRVTPGPILVQNLAVPGARVAHALQPSGTGTVLNTMILGQRSQVGAMLAAQPTLVSVWLGNNDALSAALSGDLAALTPLADFEAAYGELVAAIRDAGPQDAILIGVANAAQVAPALQPGAYFWAVAQSPDPPVPLQVSDNCAPFTPQGAPNPAGFGHLVSFLTIPQQLAQNPAGPVIIDCAPDAPFLLNADEQQAIAQRVADFNAFIQAQAQANGWIYVDPNLSLVGPELGNPDRIRKCQHFFDGSVTDAQSFMAAVQNSCPGPTAPNFFGSHFSFDAVHPSSAAHAVVADTLAGRLNQKHGLGLTTN